MNCSLYATHPAHRQQVYLSSPGTFCACSHCNRHFEIGCASQHLPEIITTILEKILNVQDIPFVSSRTQKNSPVALPQCHTHQLNESKQNTKAGLQICRRHSICQSPQQEKVFISFAGDLFTYHSASYITDQVSPITYHMYVKYTLPPVL